MTNFNEAAHIAYSTKELNMMADVQRDLRQAQGSWTCPECGETWPLNDHGYAVTCACDQTLPPGNLLRAGRK